MVEDGSDGDAETGLAGSALVAFSVWQGSCAVRIAIWTSWPIAPSDTFKMLYAIGIGGEGFVNGYNVHNDLRV